MIFPSPSPPLEIIPVYFPVTPTEVRAREIMCENFADSYLKDLANRIRNAISSLDLYRETGFSLSEPNSVIRSLEAMCEMF